MKTRTVCFSVPLTKHANDKPSVLLYTYPDTSRISRSIDTLEKILRQLKAYVTNPYD